MVRLALRSTLYDLVGVKMGIKVRIIILSCCKSQLGTCNFFFAARNYSMKFVGAALRATLAYDCTFCDHHSYSLLHVSFIYLYKMIVYCYMQYNVCGI